ncbi:MAG: hypothetical protein II300_01345 [Bacteroidales bacterium]|nr:hypothetical protein [Bacteroidales bacterium]
MIILLSVSGNTIITYRRNSKSKEKHSETLLAMSYEQREASRKLLKNPQNSLLKAQSPQLIAQNSLLTS